MRYGDVVLNDSGFSMQLAMVISNGTQVSVACEITKWWIAKSLVWFCRQNNIIVASIKMK